MVHFETPTYDTDITHGLKPQLETLRGELATSADELQRNTMGLHGAQEDASASHHCASEDSAYRLAEFRHTSALASNGSGGGRVRTRRAGRTRGEQILVVLQVCGSGGNPEIGSASLPSQCGETPERPGRTR